MNLLGKQEVQEIPWWQHPAECQEQISAPHLFYVTGGPGPHHPRGPIATVTQSTSHKQQLHICKHNTVGYTNNNVLNMDCSYVQLTIHQSLGL